MCVMKAKASIHMNAIEKYFPARGTVNCVVQGGSNFCLAVNEILKY